MKSYKTRIKYPRIDSEEKKTYIPFIIWNDGHQAWIKQPAFKEEDDHMCKGQYIFY